MFLTLSYINSGLNFKPLRRYRCKKRCGGRSLSAGETPSPAGAPGTTGLFDVRCRTTLLDPPAPLSGAGLHRALVHYATQSPAGQTDSSEFGNEPISSRSGCLTGDRRHPMRFWNRTAAQSALQIVEQCERGLRTRPPMIHAPPPATIHTPP